MKCDAMQCKVLQRQQQQQRQRKQEQPSIYSNIQIRMKREHFFYLHEMLISGKWKWLQPDSHEPKKKPKWKNYINC